MADQQNVPAAVARERVIVRTSILGIFVNLFLSVGKAIVGISTKSIAIILDAVNNLSDMLSSIVTIGGAKLAGRKPDRKHPLGHGRIEYISAMIVAAIVLYAGVMAGVESVKKIINPEEADYSILSLILLAVAVMVKVALGLYVRKKGKDVNSGALRASGSDALFDAILSASVLASALIFFWSGVSLEAYVGVLISIFILKSGIGMLIDTINDILGQRADPELAKQIKEIIAEEPEVRGAYDLFITNYGPDRNYASVHIELPDTMTVDQVDLLTREIQKKVYLGTGVIMTGIGVYSFNTTNSEITELRNKVQQLVMSHDFALQLHGFYADPETKTVRFDVVFSFDISAEEGLKLLYDEMAKECPDYTFHITPDLDLTD